MLVADPGPCFFPFFVCGYATGGEVDAEIKWVLELNGMDGA